MAVDSVRAAPEVVLASGSPRREQLLRLLIPTIRVLVSDAEETPSPADPPPELAAALAVLTELWLPPPFYLQGRHDPRHWASLKAADVARRLPLTGRRVLVLGADTVVVGPGEVLGKPGTLERARQMLLLLRNREHFVVTGVVLVSVQSGAIQPVGISAAVSSVAMRNFSDAELEGYVATGQPLDKAGGYGVQDQNNTLIHKVGGCVTNVVGLPLCLARELLNKGGAQLLRLPDEGYCAYCEVSAGSERIPRCPAGGHGV